MRNVICDEKIKNFRNLVNSNSGFVYQTYKDKGGKNFYNLVCSCMDWITVSVAHLESASTLDKDIDKRCMQIYSLISSIDLIFESIKQLHRVFINKKTIPLSGENYCFNNRLFSSEDDNTYFKTIRACFGAHPVALNQEDTKRFASWPFDSDFNTGDLTVLLYSCEANKESLQMHLSIDELLKFLKSRYDYLDVITDKIKALFVEFKEKFSNQLIETKADPLQQLYVLKSESVKRLNNEYYNSEIEDLIMIFTAEVTDPALLSMAESYKNSLLPLIKEIKVNLQKMNLVSLKNDSNLRVKPDLRKKLSYELSKFFNWVHGDTQDHLLDYYLNRFNSVTNGKFNFNKKDETNLIFLKAKLMLDKDY